ncbi:MAG TPA: Rubrerythrin [Armatimonadetes bacterium]|nr:Rubrerythrin [Armatimonadota bacterium]
MPEFANPFSGTAPDRKMTFNELTRAIRLNLAAEQEAIHLYQAHADATDNELAKAVLLDIADEEREHVGEFQRLLDILLEDEQRLLADGAAEVDEIAAELVSGGEGEEGGEGDSSGPSATVGDLTKQ